MKNGMENFFKIYTKIRPAKASRVPRPVPDFRDNHFSENVYRESFKSLSEIMIFQAVIK